MQKKVILVTGASRGLGKCIALYLAKCGYIVIANYNYGRFLPDAIESVVSQRMGGSVELIICDAGSTDCSIDVIKKYEKNIKWWCSEKDGGQSACAGETGKGRVPAGKRVCGGDA